MNDSDSREKDLPGTGQKLNGRYVDWLFAGKQRLAPEAIAIMAQRILEQELPFYELAIRGDTHAFPVEALRSLFSANRKIGVTIQSDGSRETEYYLMLGLPRPRNLALSMLVNPGKADLKHILTILALLVENGRRVGVELVATGKNKNFTTFFNAFCKFRGAVPFDFKIVPDMNIGQSTSEWRQWRAGMEKAFGQLPGPANPEWPWLMPLSPIAGEFDEKAIKNSESEFIRIFEDGSFVRHGDAKRASLWRLRHNPLLPADTTAEEGVGFLPVINGAGESLTPFSIVIAANGNEEDLRRSLDSALIQNVNPHVLPLEIIIAATGAICPPLASAYAELYPGIVKIALTGSEGSVFSLAPAIISGKYVCFLQSGNMLAEDFLSRFLLLADDCDIFCGQSVFCEKEREYVTNMENFNVSGREALQFYISGRAGSFDFGGRIYKRDFLAAHNLWPRADSFSDQILFNLRALSMAQKVSGAPLTAYYVHARDNGSGPCNFSAFTSLVHRANNLLCQNGLDYLAQDFLEKLYQVWNEGFFSAGLKLAHEHNAEAMEEWANPGACGASTRILDIVARNYPGLAALPEIMPEAPMSSIRPFDNPSAPANPQATIILFCDGGDGRKSLLSLLENTPQNIEILVFTPDSDVLKDYAQIQPRVGLFLTASHIDPALCLNRGLEKARGEYLLFMREGDALEKDFLLRALQIMEELEADFCQFNAGDGITEEVLAAGAAFELFCSGIITPTLEGKIFRRVFVQRSGHDFMAGLYAETLFIGRLCQLDGNFIMAKLDGWRSAPRQGRGFASISTIGDTCEFFECFDDIASKNPKWLWGLAKVCLPCLEEIFLPLWLALEESGTEPSPEAFEPLSHNRLFWLCLLSGRARGGMFSAPDALWPLPPKAWENPLVTVIVPTYNQEGPIQRCLASILGQSLRSLEVIVINDASTDHTLEVCQAIAALDPRVRLVDNPINRGQGWSKNMAFGLAKGRYVTLVDSDDYIADFLLHAVPYLLFNEDVDFVQFARLVIDDKEAVYRDFDNIIKITGTEFFKLYVAGRLKCWNAVAKLFRMDFIKNNEICFTRHLFEDSIFILDAYYKARAAIFDPLVAYNQIRTLHSHSAMKPIKYTPRHISGFLECAAWISRNIGQNRDIPNCRQLAFNLIKNYPAYKKSLEYLAEFEKEGIVALSTEDVENLKASPELCLLILTHYAALYSGVEWNAAPRLAGEKAIVRPTFETVPRLLQSAGNEGTPFLSVIMHARDCAREARQSLESLFGQSLEDYELLVIEDCSTRDDTLETLLQFGKNRKNLSLYATDTPLGRGAAYNFALPLARGKYIAFVEPGERFVEDFLFRVKSGLGEKTPNIAFFEALKTSGLNAAIYDSESESIDGFGAWTSCLACGGPNLGGKLFAREFLSTGDLAFGEYEHSEIEFLFRALQLGGNIALFQLPVFIASRLKRTERDSKNIFWGWIRNLQNLCPVPDGGGRAYMDWLFSEKSGFKREFLGYIQNSGVFYPASPVASQAVDAIINCGDFMGAFYGHFASFYMVKMRGGK